MATYSANFLGDGTYYIDVNETATNPASNTSTVSFTVRLVGNGSAYDGTTRYWSVTYDGTLIGPGGSFTYDFRSNNTPTLGTGSASVTHNANGSKTVAVVSGFTGGSASGNLALTYFPQVQTGPTLSALGPVVTITSDAPSQTGSVVGYDYRRSTDNANWTSAAMSSGGVASYTGTRSTTWYFQTRANTSTFSAAWSPSTSIYVAPGGSIFNGTNWKALSTGKIWNGSAWANLTTAKRWNGSAWADLQ